MKVLKQVLLTSITLAATLSCSWQYTPPADAHAAPIDRNDTTTDRTHNHRWHHDWDRKWDDNWGNSWSTYDNDITTRRRYINDVNVNNTDVANNSETWSTSIAHPHKDIPNFHEVHPWLFRGGQPTREGISKLYDMGVRTVVDLRTDPDQIASEQQLCQQQGMNFVSIPLSASRPPSNHAINKFLSVINSAHQNGANGSVFVHCHHGCDRTGVMVAIYRMQNDHFTYDQAKNEMLKYGFHPSLARLGSAVKANSQAKDS
jgi:protein-tyrosine phosphatase